MTRRNVILTCVFIVAVALLKAIPAREIPAVGPKPPSAPAAPIQRFIDETGQIADAHVKATAEWLNAVMIESGIDMRVRLVHSTHGRPLGEFALTTMREQGIGRDVGGRGLLILLDDSAKEARIEVGPHLEGIFPDAYVSYLLRENLSPEFGAGSTELAIRTTLFMINNRTRQARLGGDYDARVSQYVKSVQRLANGAGGSAALPAAQGKLDGLLTLPPRAIGEYFSPQPTVQAAYERQLEYLALGLWPQPVRLFTPDSYDVFSDQPKTRGWNDYLLEGEFGYAYEIDERGDYAMLYYTDTPFESPHFFHRSHSGWQVDIVADIRNSQEVVATYLTWTLYKSGDEYSKRFADRYLPVANTGFDEFYRVRGGDNRTMCIYGEPGVPMNKRIHDSLCLGGSLPLAGAR